MQTCSKMLWRLFPVHHLQLQAETLEHKCLSELQKKGADMSWRGHTIAFPKFPSIKYEYAEVYTVGSLMETTVENMPTKDLVELVHYLIEEIATRKYKERHDG